jgi:hypothetical protein
MDTYKIVGPYRVCEVEPGGSLTSDDLAIDGVSIEHLIGSGHLELSTSKRSAAVQESEGN